MLIAVMNYYMYFMLLINVKYNDGLISDRGNGTPVLRSHTHTNRQSWNLPNQAVIYTELGAFVQRWISLSVDNIFDH